MVIFYKSVEAALNKALHMAQKEHQGLVLFHNKYSGSKSQNDLKFDHWNVREEASSDKLDINTRLIMK